jgi:pimeloyl-[acyl-carrier protein] synthase
LLQIDAKNMSEKNQNETIPLPFNPRSPEFRANPYPTYHYLRTHHPIYYRSERKDWVLTRYADILEVLNNPNFGRSEQESAKLQSANQAPINRFLSLRQESQKLMKLWLVLRNPPDHIRIRRLLRNSFTQSRIQTLREHIQTKVDNYIDQIKERGKMDIIDDLAYPLTLGINCEIFLGIPPQEWHPQFKQWSENLSLVADLDITPLANERGLLAIAGLAEYFRNWIAKCSTDSQQQDNLISTLIKAEYKGELTEEELIANCIMMFAVGHSSTANLIGISILNLLKHPEQLHLLQADSSLIEMTISEVLRYDSPVQGISRTALSDIQLSNKTIQRGEIVNCIIAAANRDPAQFPDPDKFDIRREPNAYLSFGQGIHICIGRHLGKLVAEIAVGTLVRRLPNLSLAMESLEWENCFLGHGLKSLPVAF